MHFCILPGGRDVPSRRQRGKYCCRRSSNDPVSCIDSPKVELATRVLNIVVRSFFSWSYVLLFLHSCEDGTTLLQKLTRGDKVHGKRQSCNSKISRERHATSAGRSVVSQNWTWSSWQKRQQLNGAQKQKQKDQRREEKVSWRAKYPSAFCCRPAGRWSWTACADTRRCLCRGF